MLGVLFLWHFQQFYFKPRSLSIYIIIIKYEKNTINLFVNHDAVTGMV